jgi:hypothetical protein
MTQHVACLLALLLLLLLLLLWACPEQLQQEAR